MSIDHNDIARAGDIYREIKDLLSELEGIFRKEGGMTYERYRSYPGAHIAMAMDNDHGFLGKNMFTVEELVNDLGESDEDDDEDVDDE